MTAMKKTGSLFGVVTDVTDGWIDISLRSGGTATIFSRFDFSETLKRYLEDMAKIKICLEFVVSKTKDGTFMYRCNKAHAVSRLNKRTERVKAQADMRAIENECSNVVKGRSSKVGKSRVSLSAPKVKKSGVNYNIRQLVTGSISNGEKPLEYLP